MLGTKYRTKTHKTKSTTQDNMVYKTQDEDKQATQYVVDITICKQRQKKK